MASTVTDKAVAKSTQQDFFIISSRRIGAIDVDNHGQVNSHRAHKGRDNVIASGLSFRFYHRVWNKADESEARRILASDFRFRGSLGPELRGPDGFIAYMRSVHDALGGFTCQIEEMIAAADHEAARMIFHGRHRGRFFGIAPSGQEIRWSGAAFFKTRDGKIIELWVLGDIEGIRRQLEPQRAAAIFQL
jgi:steroid delta-isomerase-like uncharacterized protein